MKNSIKRKQFLLPQRLLMDVCRAYRTKTETEAVILSLEEALRTKKLKKLASLAGKIRMDVTSAELRKIRGRERSY